MRKLPFALAAALALAGCSTLDVRLAQPVPKEMKQLCEADKHGCLVLPVGVLQEALNEAFELGRVLGVFQAQ